MLVLIFDFREVEKRPNEDFPPPSPKFMTLALLHTRAARAVAHQSA